MNGPIPEYFIRHTNKIEIAEADFKELFTAGIFGIHFTSDYDTLEDYLVESKYEQSEGKTAIRYLKELGTEGGFIWCEYAFCDEILIGVVAPGSRIFIREHRPVRRAEAFKNAKGHLILKCLKLERKKIIGKHELLAMRARRPRQGTFVHWGKSYGLIEKIMRYGIPLPLETWEDLTPDLQEIVTYEYLREIGINGARIARLLMPIGRTMKDVDIFALGTNNQHIFVQVTNLSLARSGSKLDALKGYADNGSTDLVFVCTDQPPKEGDGIHFLDTAIIWAWLRGKQEYLRQLYR